MYEVLRGFNYRDRRFEIGEEVTDIPLQEIEVLIKEGTVGGVLPQNLAFTEEEDEGEDEEEEVID